ncbi:DUF1542 domain-containing protein [Streptococcus suis]
MSSKDMFRKEQRFSFRKFSFGLASAVIANVIFGGAIANTPVVHANTATETAAVATSERIASIPYTVNIVDQTGKVVETKEKKVLVYTVETIATATEYLTADLVPEGYAIVSGLGEVTLTENAENVFTVKVDKIAPEAVATTTTAESATSETSTAAATPEPASLTATQPTPVTSEVAEAEVAPTTSEESAKPTERTVYLSYITHYVNEANETVDRTGHLVAVTTTDDTAKTQVTVSASENMPSGWELVQDKAKVVVQLVENQTNILVFAVTKKSKEEEIAASQLSNKDVLEQVLSEGVLLSNDAARLLETSQAGNTGLEVATNNTKAVLKEAIQVFDEPSSTQEQVDAQTELVRAASKTLADELLKFDEDGVLTAMLDATNQGITVTTSSKGKVRPDYPNHIRAYATNSSQQSYNDQDFFFGLIGKELTQENSQISATAQGPDGSPLTVSLVGGGWQTIAESDKFGLEINNSGVIYGTTTITEAGNSFSWRFRASSGNDSAGSQFTFVPYTVVKTDNEPVRKAVTAGVTADEILAKVKSDVTRGNGTSDTKEATAGPLNIAFEQHFNSELTARATGTSTKVAEDAKNGKQIWHEIVGDIPTTAGTHTVTVRSTNVHGQTIDTQVVVDLYEIVKIPSSASEPAPQGYVTVSFNKTPFTQGFTLGTQTGESVKLFVKENVKWGELLNDPAWQWPTVKTAPGDTVVGWGVNVSSADNAYKPENAFSREKYKDIVVTDTKLYPNVVYEVEEVGSRTKEQYLALYGPDERDKWIFIKFDAGQGSMTYDKKQYTSRSVAAYFQGIGYDNSQFTSKVVSPTLANHTFVRWQTDAGEVLPKSGTITTEKTYKALYLAHPTDKTVVFDANKLTDTEKDSLKQAINNANTDSANLIQSITVSDTGEATVTYNDGTVVTVPASDLINEDKEPARNLAKAEIDDKLAEEKAAIEAKRDAAIAEINNTPGLTDDQKQAATDAVTNTANDALTALDTAADDAKKAIDTKTTAADFNDAKTDGEKALDDATVNGEAAIDLTKDKELAKADVDNQAKAAIEAVKNNPNLDATEQAPYIKAIEKAAEEQKAAIDAAKDTAGITDAVNAAEKVNEEQKLAAAKEDAKDKIAKDVEAANAAIESNPNLSEKEISDAKAAVADEAKKANGEIDAATTPEAVQAKEEEGTKAIAADVLDAAKQDALNKLEDDAAKAKETIAANPNLSDKEVDKALADLEKDLAKAKDAVNAATTPEKVQTAEDKGVDVIAGDVLDAAQLDALNKLEDDTKETIAAIEANPNLTEDEKKAAIAKAEDLADDAKSDIMTAETPEAVQAVEEKADKDLAKEELKAAAEDAKAAIDANDNLTPEEKAAAKDAVDVEVAKANDAIDAATKADEVDAATLAGEKAVAKEELKAAVEDAKKAIDANPNLSDAEKQAAKDALDVEVAKANDAIDAATKADEVETATLVGEKAVAKEELKAAAEDAKAAIDANDNLTPEEKAAAKAAVDASAAEANKAIDGSTSSVEVQAAKDKGNAAIAENVLDAAKQGAKNKLMEEADKAKAAIDANPNLTPEEKAAAKAEIDKAVEEAIIAINGAGTHHALGEIKLPLSALIKPVVTVTPVLDPNNLTEEEIARIKALLEENNTFPEGTEIIVSKDASVSIKYPDGTIDLVLPAEIVKQADTTAPAITDDAKGNIVVAPTKEAVEFVVTYVDNNGKAQLVVVTKGADGKWTTTAKAVIVDPVTGQVIIPGSAIKPGTVVTAYSKDMAGNVSDLNSAEVEAVDANNPAAGVKVKSVTSTSSANKSTKKAKQLPNTGEKATSATSLGLAVLGMGLALFAAKRKKDEEEA